MSGQHTPVIIKTGGDGVPGSPEAEVLIESDLMYFTEFVWDPARELWESHSTRSGRIDELSTSDGEQPDPDYTKQPFPQELASAKIEFGPANYLIAREEGDITGHNVVLVIESSGFCFSVKKPGNWKKASAMLPPITNVMFLGGNERLFRHDFTNADWHVGVHFFRGLIPTEG
ncbi:MAG TPA: hypothetical protein VN844_06440 [Pyrinomonadaceae bacterium]|nr:hypothetical protein [Pyrinomonadaceae bacterium]